MRSGLFGHGRKCLRIAHGEVGQDLAIHLDAGLVETVNQLAIGKTVEPSGSVDTGDPQTAEIALAVAAVPVGVDLSPIEGFLGGAEQATARPPIALGLFEDLFLALLGGDAGFYPWNGCFSLKSHFGLRSSDGKDAGRAHFMPSARLTLSILAWATGASLRS